MILPEQNNKLTLEKRRDLIKQISSADAGQALREELIDIMNDVGNICKVPDECWASNEVLASEARGRDIARRYIQGVYNMLIPQEEDTKEVKTHK